jgi:hypothetical protein
MSTEWLVYVNETYYPYAELRVSETAEGAIDATRGHAALSPETAVFAFPYASGTAYARSKSDLDEAVREMRDVAW